MAASICTDSSRLWLWAYCDISIRETIPWVRDRRSPPMGYPRTVTCWPSRGSSPTGIGLSPLKKDVVFHR